MAFGISGFLVQLLTAPDRDRHRRGHVPGIGTAARDDPGQGGAAATPARIASRSCPRSATGSGWSATTRSCGRSCSPRCRSRRCGGSSARPGSSSSSTSWRSGRRRSASSPGSAGSRRWSGPSSPRVPRGAGGSVRWRSSALLLAAVGNVFIPLAPAGLPLVAAGSLIVAQLLGDSAVTVYEVTEVSVRQSLVRDRALGRVASTFHVASGVAQLAATLAAGAACRSDRPAHDDVAGADLWRAGRRDPVVLAGPAPHRVARHSRGARFRSIRSRSPSRREGAAARRCDLRRRAPPRTRRGRTG